MYNVPAETGAQYRLAGCRDGGAVGRRFIVPFDQII